VAAAGTDTYPVLTEPVASGVRAIDAPAPRRREPSASIGSATAGLLDALVGDKLDAKVREAARASLAELVDATANASEQPGPRASLPWAVALTAIVVCILGSIGVTFAWLSQLERRTDEAEAYDRAMAQWLIISSDDNHEALTGLDTMLRGLAGAQGVPVDQVAVPVKSDPPTEVSMKALEALAK
jgi:hypothetical protein